MNSKNRHHIYLEESGSFWTFESFATDCQRLAHAFSKNNKSSNVIVKPLSGQEQSDVVLCEWLFQECSTNQIGYLYHPPIVRPLTFRSKSVSVLSHTLSNSNIDNHRPSQARSTVDHPDSTLLDDDMILNDPYCFDCWPNISTIDPMKFQQQEHHQQQEGYYEWRFSIVYCPVWRVPVLYFTVQQQDGTPCPVSLVTDWIHYHHHYHYHQSRIDGANNDKEDDNDDDDVAARMEDFISYDEHPITGVPSMFLHPCRTKENLMTLFCSSSTTTTTTTTISNHCCCCDSSAVRLLQWLSMVLPAVGCQTIPLQVYLTLCRQDIL
jgi:hypothetical protein